MQQPARSPSRTEREGGGGTPMSAGCSHRYMAGKESFRKLQRLESTRQSFSDNARRPSGGGEAHQASAVLCYSPPTHTHRTKCSVTALWRAVANKLTLRGR